MATNGKECERRKKGVSLLDLVKEGIINIQTDVTLGRLILLGSVWHRCFCVIIYLWSYLRCLLTYLCLHLHTGPLLMMSTDRNCCCGLVRSAALSLVPAAVGGKNIWPRSLWTPPGRSPWQTPLFPTELLVLPKIACGNFVPSGWAVGWQCGGHICSEACWCSYRDEPC